MLPIRGLLRHGALNSQTRLSKQYFYTANDFRTRPTIAVKVSGRRHASNETGENDSGHITTTREEGIFFFDSRTLALISSP